MRWFRENNVWIEVDAHATHGKLNASQATMGLRLCTGLMDVTPDRDIRLDQVNQDKYLVTVSVRVKLPVKTETGWRKIENVPTDYKLCIFGADIEETMQTMQAILEEGFALHTPEEPWKPESTYVSPNRVE